MPRPNPCLAAGIGAVSLFLLLGGSDAAVAFADPGGSRGADRNTSSDRGSDSRAAVTGDDGAGAGRRDSDGQQSADRSGSPRVRVGSGREDTARVRPGDAGSGSGGASADESGSSSRTTPAFEPPDVTFGNGRAPVIRSNDPETAWRAPSPPPAEPPPAPMPPPQPGPRAPTRAERVDTPPPVARQYVVAPAAVVAEPLWGIAGLLLFPVAGAALGYRQARAAQSAERLRRS